MCKSKRFVKPDANLKNIGLVVELMWRKHLSALQIPKPKRMIFEWFETI